MLAPFSRTSSQSRHRLRETHRCNRNWPAPPVDCAASPSTHPYESRTSIGTTASMVVIAATGRRPSIAARCCSSEKAAQPSSITVQSNSRTWASRTVEATPPLVTIPVK
jgi:hypothetical protein